MSGLVVINIHKMTMKITGIKVGSFLHGESVTLERQ